MDRADDSFLEMVAGQVRSAARELAEAAGLRSGQILVVGCSTSEILGRRIGTSGRLEVGHAVLEGLWELAESGVRMALQCCEHLNRALVVERATAEQYLLEEVSVYPVPWAGGAMAAAGMERFSDPVVVESISAHAGLDIGDTLIGMHLRPVAVPVRLSLRQIGEARLTAARTRPRLIGGERAVYKRPGSTRENYKGMAFECD